MTQITRRLGAFFIALMLPLVANAAATFWSFDWETLPYQNSNEAEGIFYQGNCFEEALGDPFTSVKLSTKYVRTGSKSARLYTDSKYANADGHRACQSNWKTELGGTYPNQYLKHRLEPQYAYSNTGALPDFKSYQLGEERWFRYAFYLPSDEGTFNYWNTGPYASSGIMIMQLMAYNNPAAATVTSDSTHEVAFILKGGPKMTIERVYGPDPVTGAKETIKPITTVNLKKDAWNEVVFMHVPRNDGSGKLKVWLNCVDWASCTPVVDFTGPTAIARFIDRNWKGGLYESNIPTFDRAIAQYVDSHKMGKRDTETESEMLALMADAFTGEVEPPPPPPQPPSSGTMVINNGAAITDNQDPINFTASGVSSITTCGINDATQTGAKWDYVGATGGKFTGGDIDAYASSTGTVTCYDETYTYIPTITSSGWTNSSATTDEAFSGDAWGYTTGIAITKFTTATNADVYKSMGSDIPAVAGDRIRFDFTYSCTGTSCENLYFDVADELNAGDDRNRLTGTAGALTLTNLNGGHGTSIDFRNYTLGDDTYRAVIWFTVTVPNQQYRLRVGWKNSNPVGSVLNLHEVIHRKNWTTQALTTPVTFDVADTTKPTISGCAMDNNPDGASGYRASISCTADEIGGTDYAMITTTNTSPDAAAVQAGTGAIWSSQKSADTTEIAFEASGMSYQDLWAWIVRCDAADNCSDVAGVTFDDGVGPGQSKKIKFVSQVLRRAGVPFTGTVERMAVWTANPLTTLRQSELFTASNVSFTSGNFSSGAYTGDDVNALQPATTYYMSAADADSDPYWVVPFQIIIE